LHIATFFKIWALIIFFLKKKHVMFFKIYEHFYQTKCHPYIIFFILDTWLALCHESDVVLLNKTFFIQAFLIYFCSLKNSKWKLKSLCIYLIKQIKNLYHVVLSSFFENKLDNASPVGHIFFLLQKIYTYRLFRCIFALTKI
jgi:hypothetical protein